MEIFESWPPMAKWSAFVIGIAVSRLLTLQCLMNIGRSKYADETRITRKPPITAKQLKRESVWPLGMLIDMCLGITLFYFGYFNDLPYFNFEGFLWNFLIHVTVIEFVYYWWHVALHWKFLYKNWHQYHHASINTEPTTGYSFEIGERLSYTALFAVAPLCLEYYGMQSLFTFAFNMIWFDVMNGGGHINFELFPRWYMDSILCTVWYTPSYHSIHHTRFKYNYSLFMPWPDMMFGTTDWPRTKEVFLRALDGANRGSALSFTANAESEAASHNHMTQVPSESASAAPSDSV